MLFSIRHVVSFFTMKSDYLFCLFPIIFPLFAGTSAYFFWAALRSRQKCTWKLGLSVVLACLFLLSAFFTSAHGIFGSTYNTLTFLSTLFGFFSAAYWLIIRVDTHHKRITMGIVGAMVLLYCTSFVIRDTLPEEVETRCAIQAMKRALDDYHRERGAYPSDWQDPVLQRFYTIHDTSLTRFACGNVWRTHWLYSFSTIGYEARANQPGWLYKRQAETYILGNAYTPRRLSWFGLRTCVYTPESNAIRCSFDALESSALT